MTCADGKRRFLFQGEWISGAGCKRSAKIIVAPTDQWARRLQPPQREPRAVCRFHAAKYASHAWVKVPCEENSRTLADLYAGYQLTGNGGLGVFMVRNPDGELIGIDAAVLARWIFPTEEEK